MSCLKINLYSALEVIILYGSLVPLVTKSSIKTPVYPSERVKIIGSFPWTLSAAFTPATKPCAAASSYPELPFNCPAPYNPLIVLNSNVDLSCVGSIESYSMAYAVLIISTFSNPSNVLYIWICTSSGNDDDIPATYISNVSSPSGSINIWCLFLSGNFITLSSIDGQYLGPTPSIAPLYIGDLSILSLIILWVSSFV